ncbi:MAG TPA: hypothetical protein VG476_02500 [Acidimicrobiales bacterium]|nr:hypothetical protein [Acidimicrobiales bacterium]
MHGSQWTVSTNRKRAVKLARKHGQRVMYRKPIASRADIAGWDCPTWIQCAEAIPVPAPPITIDEIDATALARWEDDGGQ